MSSLRFALDEVSEEGDVVEVFLGGELGEVIEVLGDEGELEVIEMVAECLGFSVAGRFSCGHGGGSRLDQSWAGMRSRS